MILLPTIHRTLNGRNIESTISAYVKLLEDVPLSIQASNILDLLTKIKREKISAGPYPHVTLFEAANRIMTDLVILFGIKELLSTGVNGIMFKEFVVELGNENKNKHDITSSIDGHELIGEAFNVAPSFFQGKKASSLKKLRGKGEGKKMLIIVYNSDAVHSLYKADAADNEYHLAIKIELPSINI